MSDEPVEKSSGSAADRAGTAAPVMADLRLRIISALVLGSIALGVLYAGAIPFALLIFAISLMMCWEWGQLVRGPEGGPALIVHGAAVSGAIALATLGFAAPAVIALVAGTCVVGALRFGETARLSALGVLYIGLPAVALIALRTTEPYGFPAVLFVVLAVIATDTAAYFAGRSLGGPKLWPRVSPKKTWSGLIGGVSAAALVGVGFGLTIAGASPGRLAMIGVILGLFAQGGDLAESSLKRRFDVKDASGLLPGHGGFMDRMDGLVAASIVAMLIGLSGSVYVPARALLLGF